MSSVRPLPHKVPAIACADHVADGVWIGGEFPIECIYRENCSVFGCWWRRYHKLKPDEYRRPPKQAEVDL